MTIYHFQGDIEKGGKLRKKMDRAAKLVRNHHTDSQLPIVILVLVLRTASNICTLAPVVLPVTTRSSG